MSLTNRWVTVATALGVTAGLIWSPLSVAAGASAAPSTQANQTRGWAADQSRWESAAASYGLTHASDRAALFAAINTAAGVIAAADYVSAAGLELELAADRALYSAGASASLSALTTSTTRLTAGVVPVAAAETDQATSAAAQAAQVAKVTAQATADAAARRLTPPARITVTPVATPAPVVADFKTRAQTILNGFGDGAIIAVAPSALTLGAYGTCHAKTTRGLPTITIQTCPESFSERKLYDLLAHEDVHTVTPATVNFPLEQSVPGIPILEEIADCIAMGSPRFRTDPAPGGYMTSCSAGQLAASLAAIGRTS